MNPSAKPPRDHHIIPRFYLKGFARPSPGRREPTIWVHEKGRPVRPSTPEHEARERDYYVFGEKPHVDYRFEYFLSQAERHAARIFHRLEEPDYFFNFDEKDFIAHFAALMFSRVRPLREYLDRIFEKTIIQVERERARDREQFEADCRDFQAKSGKFFDVDSMRELILSGNYEIKQTSAGYNLKQVFKTTQKLGPILSAKNWSLLRSDNGAQHFVTSDNPICGVLPGAEGMSEVGVGLGLDGADVIFPLRPDACLVMLAQGREGIGSPTPSSIKSCNTVFMMLARRNLFAAWQSQNLDRQFQKIGCTSVYGKTALMPPKGRSF